MNRYRRAATVLECLGAGHQIEMGKHIWVLCDDDYGALRLGVTAKKHKGASTKATDVVLFTELDVGGFVQLCDRLTEDEMAIIIMNKVLNEN